MEPPELYEALHALISERVPPAHLVAADRKCEFLDIRAVQLDPVDLRGYRASLEIARSGSTEVSPC